MKPNKKKLLVATVGLAAINYACSTNNGEPLSSGNLVAPGSDSGQQDDAMISSGNLMGPGDTGVEDASIQDAMEEMISSGNLMAPPDAGSDASDPDGGDAGK